MGFMSAREFNQNLSKAKRLAETEPLIVTRRGKPKFVLLRFDDYQKLHGEGTLADTLRMENYTEAEFPRFSDQMRKVEL